MYDIDTTALTISKGMDYYFVVLLIYTQPSMNELFIIMSIWIFTFVTSFLLYYVVSVNFPEYRFLNTLIIAMLGFATAYLLGVYLIGSELIMVPLIF